ncbi:uncharacterized protein A4U43_UnF2630 [Asparagus officinalis]|uniref:Root cap n=1 Tax=Asparagus officinalis TaxID=4686 RepID=A0A1R3L766_ASPOF|nr:uncharacterized protein LOC109827309 [Asparagus officinalis]ONK55476.1 uncharacterized protein A4U43_UnF2630 [Asparagus officinalis]
MSPTTRSALCLMVVCAALFLSVAEARRKVKCHNKKAYPHCAGYQFYCPDSCEHSCYVDCELCRPVCSCDKPGGVCQDPKFVGGDGITFYFHGKKDRDFCLLSDSDLHINAHFIGKRGPTMSRDFTWVQSVALLFDDHRLYVGAQKTAAWDNDVDRLEISYDGQTIDLPATEGARWQSSTLPALSIVRSLGTNAVTLEAEGKFKITANVVPITEQESRVHNYGITAEDCFAHLELGFKFYSLTDDVHGVLGQTYREGYVSRVKMSANNPIMGGEHKFSASELFAPDCAVSRFGRAGSGIAMMSELSSVNCASGIAGRGLVCKK